MQEQAELAEIQGDPVPAEVRELMALFTRELAGVRFPDLDAEVLAAAAREVRECAEAVDLARQALETAREDLETSRLATVRLARRGVAYVKVYTADDPDLSARVQGLSLAREEQPPKKTRRRRKSKPRSVEADAAVSAKQAGELPLDSPALRVVAG